MWISALTLLKALLSLKVKDDDDKEKAVAATNPALGAIYYFTSRLLREQAAFNTPHGLWDEGEGSVATFVPIGISGGGDLSSIIVRKGFEGLDQLDDKKDWDWLYYKKNKPGYYQAGDSKATVQFLRRTIFGDILYGYDWMMGEEPEHVGRTTNVLFHGYEAAKAFDYGRRMN